MTLLEIGILTLGLVVALGAMKQEVETENPSPFWFYVSIVATPILFVGLWRGLLSLWG